MAGMRSLAEGDVSPSHTTTSFMGLKLYAAILVLLGVLLAISLLIFLYYRRKKCSSVRPKKSNHRLIVKHNPDIIIPVVSKEIITTLTADSSGSTPTKKKMGEILIGERLDEVRIMEEGKGSGGGGRSTEEGSAASASEVASVVSVDTAHSNNIGWGRWYSLRELETATSGFDSENVIGEGGYGIVYRGVLEDGSVVAVKNLLNNKGQAQKEFEVEVEAIGRVRHKNLVGLIGYCAEGAQRMLVYEFVDNGNLEQWLHGDVGPVSPLTWDIRMKIAIGTAKGLAYLHEGLEPKVVHRDVKSSNILLDKNWNPKVSDFGLAKLLGSDASYVTTRVMGTFGYVSPEYASTGMLNEGSDVYSFGVLLMELITGRSPVDYARPPGEINLVDWFKGMVASRRGEEVLDPLVESQPSPRVMKRALLVCLRCIDMDAAKRPKMGQIVHMLEADEFPFRSDHRATARESPGVPLPPPHQSSVANKWLLPRKDVEVRGA